MKPEKQMTTFAGGLAARRTRTRMNRSLAAATKAQGKRRGADLAFGFGVAALGVYAFFRGFSLPQNPPEHRAHGKGDNWRT